MKAEDQCKGKQPRQRRAKRSYRTKGGDGRRSNITAAERAEQSGCSGHSVK